MSLLILFFPVVFFIFSQQKIINDSTIRKVVLISFIAGIFAVLVVKFVFYPLITVFFFPGFSEILYESDFSKKITACFLFIGPLEEGIKLVVSLLAVIMAQATGVLSFTVTLNQSFFFNTSSQTNFGERDRNFQEIVTGLEKNRLKAIYSAAFATALGFSFMENIGYFDNDLQKLFFRAILCSLCHVSCSGIAVSGVVLSLVFAKHKTWNYFKTLSVICFFFLLSVVIHAGINLFVVSATFFNSIIILSYLNFLICIALIDIHAFSTEQLGNASMLNPCSSVVKNQFLFY
ncbi:MAG: PrsW family intramembrane metalloprotease [Candidatus Riflebacteria bacterium]|nr:PrsW family intramembrane metalloprotease [Candidatus Riflebacteria bacterium]